MPDLLDLLDSPGTIALPTSEMGRFTLFTVCLASTMQPKGTNLNISAGASVTQNLNQTIKDMLPESRWLWILGDDHTWEPDCLMRMLSAMDDAPHVDIMVPLVVKRNPPWHLVVFKAADPTTDPDQDIPYGVPHWMPYNFEEVPESGLFEVDAAGSAGMLIKREVLDNMGFPWFESTNGVYLNEDVTFCVKAREAGYTIFANADITMGHIGIFNVRPMRREGRWGALAEFSTPEEKFRHVFMPVEDEHPVATSGR